MKSKFLYNNSVLVSRRKELRNNSTEEEKVLWDYLKHGKLGGFKFIRQYSAGPYVLDFYCPKIRLAVELDGSQHNEGETILYDKDRERYLESINIKVIRFWNYELVKNPKSVLNKIYDESISCRPPLKIRGGRG